jgi:hypothetical protein
MISAPQIKSVREISLNHGMKLGGSRRRCNYYISPSTIDNRGYRNIRCQNSDKIECIKWNVKGARIAKVDNTDGKMFAKFREILEIADQTIIPFLPVNYYVPYLELCETEIHIEFNDDAEDELMNNFTVTYDEVEIDSENLLLLAQYANINKFIPSLYKHNIQVIPMLQYTASDVVFTGEEYVGTYATCAHTFKLYFNDILETILIYTQNNSVTSHSLLSDDRYSERDISTVATMDGEFLTIKLKKGIDCREHTPLKLSINLEQTNEMQKVCIYEIGTCIHRIIGSYLIKISS